MVSDCRAVAVGVDEELRVGAHEVVAVFVDWAEAGFREGVYVMVPVDVPAKGPVASTVAVTERVGVVVVVVHSKVYPLIHPLSSPEDVAESFM